MRRILILALVLSIAAAFGCADAAPTGVGNDQVFAANDEQQKTKFRVETVVTGLQVAWAFAWLPNGDMLLTERQGRVRLIAGGELQAEPVYVVPDVEPSSESGLMDISVDPEYATNSFVYLAYAYDADGKRVKIVRYRYADGKFAEPTIVIQDIPAAPNHAGTRARFGPDGMLYVTTGDATEWNLAQDNSSLAGKTLRLNPDGSVPTDNPFVGREGYRPEIWSTGHRNAQGLAWQPGTGLMFQTEHGPSQFEGRGGGADEVNIVEAGKNYGWPVIWGTRTQDGMEPPLLEYTPACAPASAAFYNGNQFPEFRGNFFFGCLRGTRIIRVVLDGRNVVRQENLLEGNVGRVREVAEGPDGFLYFSTSNRDGRGSPAAEDDRVMRLVPETPAGAQPANSP